MSMVVRSTVHLVHDGNKLVVVEGVWLRHPSDGWKLSELCCEWHKGILVLIFRRGVCVGLLPPVQVIGTRRWK